MEQGTLTLDQVATRASQLWFNSRSQIEDGRGFCQRARYLTYHAGPNGYGISRRAISLPLATGTHQHTAMKPILGWCRDHDAEIQEQLQHQDFPLLVPREVVRAAIAQAQREYDQQIETRGFAYTADDPGQQQLVREQKALIAGLTWAWVQEVLPEVLRDSRIIEVEHDEATVYQCACGLGDFVGSQADHDARGCTGKALMTMPDFLAQRRDTLALSYHEFKTTGMDHPTFRDQWEVKMQMITATVSAELRWGQPVVEIYVHGLIKGKREQDYNWETGKKDSGHFKQQSVACYGYLRPAEPPLQEADIKPLYKNWDDYEQKEKQVSKKHKKTPVWELPLPVPDGWTIEEAWSEFIGPQVRRKMLAIVGPLSKQDSMVQGFFREARGEEDRWQEGVWHLYALTEDIAAHARLAGIKEVDYWRDVWSTPRFQEALDQTFPRSYACRRYGARHKCQFEDICFGREGWAHPLTISFEDHGDGPFVLRRPHHAPELEQAIARGLLPPAEGLAEDGEEAESGW